jgi:hypothetical protein
MNPSKTTAFVLRLFVTMGIIVMAAGLILSEQEYGNTILWSGILILICAPFFGILTTLFSLISEKDWKWAKVAIVLIIIITADVVISILL